jgi:hypothetical protein
MDYRLTIRKNDRTLHCDEMYFNTQAEMGEELLKWDEDEYIIEAAVCEWHTLEYSRVPPRPANVNFW